MGLLLEKHEFHGHLPGPRMSVSQRDHKQPRCLRNSQGPHMGQMCSRNPTRNACVPKRTNLTGMRHTE